MRVGLYGQQLDAESAPFIVAFLHSLEDRGIHYRIHEGFYALLEPHLKTGERAETFATGDRLDDVDLLFTFGGDGTLLRAARLVYNTGIPLAGVNMGRLGFLANYRRDTLIAQLDDIVHQRYSVSARTLLSLELSEQQERLKVNFALNEVSVNRKTGCSMISIRTQLNGEFLNTYWADGLIISTPTGSTGYSLSCGGPILMPQNGNIALTPIAPHNLNVRPIIVSDDSVITLRVTSREAAFMLTLDSRWIALDTHTELRITKAPHKVKIIHPKETSFLNTLRSKLHWGMDLRN